MAREIDLGSIIGPQGPQGEKGEKAILARRDPLALRGLPQRMRQLW